MENIERALHFGHISGNGHFTRQCEMFIEEELGVPKVLLTTSCTHALEMAAVLLGIGPGDEVILPSFTFVSTANAFILRGAKVVFADIDSEYLNLDPDSVEQLMTSRTQAIVPVHYAGVGCDMERLASIARAGSVMIVEDNAHGLFGRIRGKHLGTFGSMAALSFHETKNLTCGEGGALLLNDPQLIRRAEIVREKGTDRARFLRGEVDKYTWVDVGSSWLPSDILAAVLLSQLESWRTIQSKRRAIWERYACELREWATDRKIRLPVVPNDREQAYHMFYLLLRSVSERDSFLNHMRAKGILAVHHYIPLHSSPMGRRVGARAKDCPVTTDIAGRLVRLPFFTDMTSDEQSTVIAASMEWKC